MKRPGSENGEIHAKAGGTEEHSALAAEVLGTFRDATRSGPCRVHTSDLRLYVEASGLAIAGGRVPVRSSNTELAVDEVYGKRAVL